MQEISAPILIDGKKIARKVIESLKKFPNPNKKLAAVLVGENPASISFLKQKEKISKELGIEFRLYKFPVEIEEKDLIEEIKKLNRDEAVGGILIQLPLPAKFNRETIIATLDPKKDIDALLPGSSVLPLAVEVVKDILEELHYPPENKIVGVVGRGFLVGKPIAEWLSGKCREVIIFHTKTDLSRIKDCDLVICGAGKAGLIKPEMLKSGAGVIDFGFSAVNGKISGDFDSSNLSSSLSFYTPTPGGTGPILVAELFKNFYRLN